MKHKLALLGLLIITAAIRCLHLLDRSKDSLVNPDSWFFSITARGDGPWFQTGLSPLIHYTGHWGELLIPPFIGVLTAIVIYILAAKIFDKTTALLSVGVWSVFISACTPSLAGNIDRDGLTLLLTLTAITIYAFSKTWKGALGVAAIAGLIYWEWSWIGVMVVAVIIIVTALAEYWQTKRVERPQVLLTLGGLAALVGPFLLPQFWANIGWLSNSPNISEMTPLTVVHLWPLWLLLPFPIAFSCKFLYDHRQAREDAAGYPAVKGLTFLFAWCMACIITGLAAYRLAQFLIPAACIVAGFGFSLMLKDKMLTPAKKQAVIVFSIVMLILSATFAVDLPENLIMPKPWVDAMHYMKDNTPQNAKVLTWWDNGYWITKNGERASLTDGGHASDTNTNHFIGLVYCTDNDRYAAQIMQEYETQYLVMSTRELHYFKTIEKAAGQSGDGGLYERSSSWNFESPYFQEIYRSDDVWILRVKCATCGG